MRIWCDGRLVDDPTQSVVRADDHGLTVGDGVFEAVKVVQGQAFALSRHLRRLERSAAAMGLPVPDVDHLRAGVSAVVPADLALGVLRITYTAGPSPLGSPRGNGSPTYVVAVAAKDRPGPTTALEPSPWPRNERGALAGVKSTSYGENVLALAHAHARGATESLFANLGGNVCEGTGSNVGYVVDGEARTPTLRSGCLAGITRALLLQWAAEDGIPIREVDEPIAVLDRAEEIFLMSTIRDVQAVERYGERSLDAPGPLTRALAETWRRHEPLTSDP